VRLTYASKILETGLSGSMACVLPIILDNRWLIFQLRLNWRPSGQMRSIWPMSLPVSVARRILACVAGTKRGGEGEGEKRESWVRVARRTFEY